jgi:hypothetical protein
MTIIFLSVILLSNSPFEVQKTIFCFRPLKLSYNFDDLCRTSNDTQIVSNLKHNQYISLKLWL